jgi:tetratricopeptide (TPR) repeat protein
VESDLVRGCEVDESSIALFTKIFNNGMFEALVEIAEKELLDYPNSIFLNNLLAESYAKLGDDIKSVMYYDSAIELIDKGDNSSPEKYYLPNIYNNLGVAYKAIGFLEKSEKKLQKAIKYAPDSSSAYNNYGNLLSDKADILGARKYFLKAIELDENNFKAYWNLHSTVTDFDQAKNVIELCLEKAPGYGEAIFTLAGINAFAGDSHHFDKLMETDYSVHPIMTSIKWILSLPVLPEIYFNRWAVLDRAVELSNKNRPFYEFGVWMGDSFKYLIKSYNSGFGFDTFEGLPESWGPIPKGAYSSFGSVPKIPGGRFIVGEFEHTLPKFFQIRRPKASLINFDADLYTSTLCALMNAENVIDSSTILVFDEFIVNKNWEQDEYRALNEFCDFKNLSYEVLAVSLFSKQAVVKLSHKQ